MDHPLILNLKHRLRTSFLLRWTLANMAGWTVGLYLSALSLSTPALCLLGLLVGGIVGAAQWYVIRQDQPTWRDWIIFSAAGGFVGMLPAAFAWVLVTLGWGFGIAVVGALIGGGVGVGQWYSFYNRVRRAEWWIVANVGAGAACALLTLAPIIWGLPIGLLLGTAVYGYVTGRVFLWLQKSNQ